MTSLRTTLMQNFSREIKAKDSKDCLKFKKDGKVHDKKCSDKLRAICARKYLLHCYLDYSYI